MIKKTDIDFKKINWVEVLVSFGVDRNYLNNSSKRHGPCPICTGVKVGPKSKHNGLKRFRFSNETGLGEWFCSTCGGGNGLNFLRKFTSLSDREILTEIGRLVNNQPMEFKLARPIHVPSFDEVKNDCERTRKLLQRTWDSSRPLRQNDLVARYLRSRVKNFNCSFLSNQIRFNPKLVTYDCIDGKEMKVTLPGMVTKLILRGKPITIHRTFLTKEGNKANIGSPKKLMSPLQDLSGCAAHLNSVPNSRVLAVTEGIENGCAVMMAFRNEIEVWAFYSATNLAKGDIPRDRFDKVIIFVDHDEYDEYLKAKPGEYYARKLYAKLIEQGFEVELRIPPNVGEDFKDVWNAYVDGLESDLIRN